MAIDVLATHLADALTKIKRLKGELNDARNYAAEISQGVSHYPHDEGEPCVRCERDEAKHRTNEAHVEIERLKTELAEHWDHADICHAGNRFTTETRCTCGLPESLEGGE